MHDTNIIEVNLSAVSHNIRLLRQIVGPECVLCPIVKADAYGLGATRVAKTMLGAGAHMLAVYTPNQATELVNAAISAPILVLMPVRNVDRTDELYRGLICGKLHLTVHDTDHLQSLIAISERFGAGIPVHLEVDTGMARGGCSLEEAPALLERIARHPRLELAGLFTHFAHAEEDVELTERQLATFDSLVADNAEFIPKTCAIHAANTFATLRAQRYHKSMVRIGLAWAGYGMESLNGGEIIADGQHLQPAVTWRSHIVQLRRIPAGATVGYSSRWRADRPTTLAAIPVGYADGYPALAGHTSANKSGASVGVRCGESLHFVPVVGAVNMDQIMIDVTDLCDDTSAIQIGTEVELISADASAPNHLPRIAELAGTFSHEMMCRLNPRVKRHYVLKNASRSQRSDAPAVAAAS